MDVLENFEEWKQFLGTQIDRAQAMGMSKDQIARVAEHIGDFLAHKVDPKNVQQRLLKQMWDVANEDEQQAIARVMVKLADKAQ
ncbi:MAG: DUF3243 domain-containing protein [Alicyclobacillaceae bacterium]|nr:DUF3243 domain-containing protein [Alicyclobacillaceae bacterium]